MVAWQVANGYLERRSDPRDRRVVRVALTQTGRRLCRTMDRFIRKRVERVLRRFAPEEREPLIAMIRRLVDVVIETE
jgi:DNA-binding MarR family transcriptional regulator